MGLRKEHVRSWQSELTIAAGIPMWSLLSAVPRGWNLKPADDSRVLRLGSVCALGRLNNSCNCCAINSGFITNCLTWENSMHAVFTSCKWIVGKLDVYKQLKLCKRSWRQPLKKQISFENIAQMASVQICHVKLIYNKLFLFYGLFRFDQSLYLGQRLFTGVTSTFCKLLGYFPFSSVIFYLFNSNIILSKWNLWEVC